MNSANDSAKRSVYIVCFHLGHRESLLATLGSRFEKSTVVTFAGPKTGAGHRIIRPRINPTGILRLLGLNRLKKTLDRYLHFPSPARLAVAAAKPVLAECIERDLNEGFEVCLIQATPPHGLCTLGLYLKNAFPSIRWLVDWQDLWSFDEFWRDRVPGLYRNRQLRLEKTILDTCDLNITTNPKAAEVLHAKFGVPRDKLAAISHPYHPEDRAELLREAKSAKPRREHGPITIGFLGRLSKPPKVPGERVLKAVTDALGNGIDLEFHIFGDQSEITGKSVAVLGCDRIILHERVAHLEALKRIARCDFLLITLADLENCHVIMHAKLPHYFILNRPILAMVPPASFVAEAVETTRSGVVIGTDADWGAELARILRAHESGEFAFSPDEEAIAKYSWDSISRQWIDAIERPAVTPT